MGEYEDGPEEGTDSWRTPRSKRQREEWRRTDPINAILLDGVTKENRAEALRAQAMKMLEEAAAYDGIPEEDPFPDGQVITFQKTFQGSSIEYMYAAVRADGLWNTTGPRSPKAYNWKQLITWLRGDVKTLGVVSHVLPLSVVLDRTDGLKQSEGSKLESLTEEQSDFIRNFEAENQSPERYGEE